MIPYPVTVLTGFLGSGKTTLLNRLLRDPAFTDTAVIVNEFGEVGIDNLLIETVDEGIVLLSAGCLCCTIRGELADTLEDLARRRDGGEVPAFRRVLIETTGLADPAPILQTLMALEGSGQPYRLDGVITVVDAVNGEATLDTHTESVKQAAVADSIVLAKLDITPDIATTGRLFARLRAINPAARITDARMVDAADLVAAGFDIASKGEDVRSWLAADRYGLLPHGNHGHQHDRSRHGERIRSFALECDIPLPPARLEQFLDLLRAQHGPSLLRMKALVKLADDPGRPIVLHAVQHVLHPLVRLDRWPSEDRSSRLVFIMRDIDPTVIERLFAAFTDEPRLDAADAAALMDNPLALR
jgi:G3E family GTPase